MNLVDIKKNQRALIKSINLDNEKYIQRLRDIGFYEGSEITCLKKAPLWGPNVYQVNNSVFSLDSSITKEIQIEEI
jgi:Fe2+ transport system protein FeoA